MVPHTHPVSVQVMPDGSPLRVAAYNLLLCDTIISIKVMEEVACIRATLAARKKQATAASRASTSSAMGY